MSFKYENDASPKGLEYCVWQREPLAGNLVIVVIDDEFDYADNCPRTLHDSSLEVFPLLRTHVTNWDDTRAIGFFDFTIGEEDVAEDLKYIQKWINEIKDDNTQVYFLVDVRVGPPGGGTVASDPYIKKLTKLYPADQIAYLTKSPYGHEDLEHLIFQKGDVANHAINHGELSPKFMSFLGILHEDDIINEAILFYAKAWNEGWDPEGWIHDELQNKCSDHLRALADWLKIDVNDLCDWQGGQSAKSLMIWVPTKSNNSLWGTHRPIQGKVLKAAMEKLKIPLSETAPIPEEPIDMPRTPCLPFLISLRSFLLCCKKHDKPVPVKEVEFSLNDKYCRFRLILKKSLEDPDRLKNRYCNIKSKHGKRDPGEHPLAKSLVKLTYCITDGLEDMGRDYMRLFTDGAEIEGTETSVVEVGEITETYIDLIWDVE